MSNRPSNMDGWSYGEKQGGGVELLPLSLMVDSQGVQTTDLTAQPVMLVADFE